MCLPTRLVSQQSGSKHHRSRSVHPFGRPFVYFVRRSLTGSQLRLPSGGRRGAQLEAGAAGSEQAPPLRRHRRGRGPSAVHRTAPPATWGGWAWDWPAGSASHRALLRTELVLRARAQLARSLRIAGLTTPPSLRWSRTERGRTVASNNTSSRTPTACCFVRSPPHAAPQASLAFEPDVVILGPFGKHDSLAPYPPRIPRSWRKRGFRPSKEQLAEWTAENYDTIAPTFDAAMFAEQLKALCAVYMSAGAHVILALPVQVRGRCWAHSSRSQRSAALDPQPIPEIGSLA